MNKTKRRFIAYIFFLLAAIFLVFSFNLAQKEHSKNNWYITQNPGDEPFMLMLDSLISYTVKTDDYIADLEVLDENYLSVFQQSFYVPNNFLDPKGGRSYKHFSITCDRNMYLKINMGMTGMFVKYGSFELHRNLKDGKLSIYFENKKMRYVMNY